MIRSFAFASSIFAGLILLAGCNQNTALNGQPGTPPAPVAANDNSAGPQTNGSSPNTTVAAGEFSSATQMFIQDAALSDMYEVQAGQIATMKSQSPDIKQFARQMVDAHTQHLNQLKQLIAKDAPGYKPPMQLDQTRQALLDDLQAANDQVFDPRYIAQQIDQHNEAMILMRGYIKAGDNPDFKALAQQTVPIITMHLQEINAIDRAHHGHPGAQASNVGIVRTR
jgi:putative membrane protein